MLIAVALFLPAYRTAPGATAQEGGEVSGVVVADGLSFFIAGANIHLYSLDRVLQTKSDAQGRSRLNFVPAGTYELEVAAVSYKTKTVDQVKVGWGSRLSYEVPLRITNPGCSPLDSISYGRNGYLGGPLVQGVVVDAGSARTPLSGVEVRLFHTDDKPTSHVTNERGEFQFTVPTPGRYFIQIVRRGYQTTQSQQFWIAREGRTVVTMRQLKVGQIIGCE